MDKGGDKCAACPVAPLGSTLTPQLVGRGWRGEAAVCGQAESGPNPRQGATLAPADLADWAEFLSAPPSATRHYSLLAFIPKQGVTLGAAAASRAF